MILLYNTEILQYTKLIEQCRQEQSVVWCNFTLSQLPRKARRRSSQEGQECCPIQVRVRYSSNTILYTSYYFFDYFITNFRLYTTSLIVARGIIIVGLRFTPPCILIVVEKKSNKQDCDMSCFCVSQGFLWFLAYVVIGRTLIDGAYVCKAQGSLAQALRP